MPVGACIVADAAERAGHEVQLLDLMFSRHPLRDIHRIITTMNPDVIGLSVRNIDNNDFQQPQNIYENIQPLVKTIREATDAKIVCGGGAFGVMPEALLKYSGADYAVLGDGEIIFPKLLESFSNSNKPEKTPGIAWIDNDVFRFNEGHSCNELTDTSFPNYNRWINVRAYQRRMCTAALQTKRGCPFSCVYCTYHMAEGKGYRLLPPTMVVESVRKMIQSGIRNIEFVDSVFNSPYDHALTICEHLARSQIKGRFETFELNPAFVDTILIKAMEDAGFVGIGITAESVSTRVLKGLGKEYTKDEVVDAADAVSQSRLPCMWLFLMGGPGETKDTVRETFYFIQEHVRPSDIAFINIGIRVYPGTEVEKTAREQKMLSVSSREMLKPVFYFSPDIDPDWLVTEVESFALRHINVMGPHSINMPFIPALYRIGHLLGLQPPLWKHTRALKRALRLVGVRT